MKRLTVFSLVLVFLLTFSAGLFAQDVELLDPWVSEKAQGQHGGTLITTLLGDPKTFNTIIAQETSSTDITDGLIFEGLVTRHGLQPNLSLNWLKIGKSVKTVQFTLSI